MKDDIYSYIKTEESNYETQEIDVGENWRFNMRTHLQMLFHLKNGIFYTGENDWLRQFRNFMEGMIELANWTEDIDIGRDVLFFTENDSERALTFLIKKYHDSVYVRKHDLDKMVDEITESDNAFGGVLVQRGAKRPEVVQLVRIAFCDQTQLLGGPLGLKTNFSPSSLRAMSKKGWGSKANGATISIEDLILQAEETKEAFGTLSEQNNKVTGKTIEVYIVRGDMPESWLRDDGDEEKQVSQVQVVAFYQDKSGEKSGVTLYRKEEKDGLKFFSSSEVEGRALGRGVGEKIMPDQIWSNWKMIHKNSLLEAASKVPLMTDDSSFTAQKVQDVDNLEVLQVSSDTKIPPQPIQTAMVNNINLFENAIKEDFEHAQFAGQSYNSLMGIEESSGTTFRGQNQLIQQGRGPHDRRRGQRAKFLEEIYRWDILLKLIKELKKDKKFWATLTPDEMRWVADQLAAKVSNEKIKKLVLAGKMVSKEEQAMMMEVTKLTFFKRGNKQMFEILESELEGIEDRIGINIAGKQKNLAGISDRILSIIEVALVNPNFRANLEANGMSGAFNDLLEYSGLSPADFSTVANSPMLSPTQPQPKEQPKLLNEQR